MKEKKNKGITLIALVITIIVLLILAGVTIATLFGNNGILTQSQLAVKETKEASAREQVEMAWIACETEFQSALTKDSTKTRNEYFTQSNMNKHLTGQGRVLNDFQYNGEGENEIHFKSNEQGEEYTFYLNGNGNAGEIATGTLVENIKAQNYGDYIDYPVDLNDDSNKANDWKIFYNDGENVFIIASEPLSIDKLELVGHSWSDKIDQYNGALDINETVARKFQLNWIFVGEHKNSRNDNMKVVAALMDTNEWNAFATGISGAQTIGSPTLEMWINSWNAKYPNMQLRFNREEEQNSDGSIYADTWSGELDEGDSKQRSFGYMFGKSNDKLIASLRFNEAFEQISSVDTSLYFMSNSYYLASPSADRWYKWYGTFLFSLA